MESVAVQAMNASSPSENISCNVVSAVYSSISSSSRNNSACSTCLTRASSKGSSVSAIPSMMAHGAAESVAPTNYYTEITVSERNKGGKGKVGVTNDRK